MKTPCTILTKAMRSLVRIAAGDVDLDGELELPANTSGVVVFVHGSGSSRHSPRNQFVASVIRRAGMGTLLFDLLTSDEEQQDAITGSLRFDIGLLARRLVLVTRWLQKQPYTGGLKVGYFGASTGGGAALMAAAELGGLIAAVVSRGGRPDLAADALPKVGSPTLLIVGEYDKTVISLNEEAYPRLRCEKGLHIVPKATHLFEEPGRLEQVAELSAQWFGRHLSSPGRKEAP